MISAIDTLLETFRAARAVVDQSARWAADDPRLPADTCRYCGRFWRRWAGSKLDGHAACFVTPAFKHHVGGMLRSPSMTYGAIAKTIGVTPAVVRSWTYPIRSDT